MRLYYKLCAQHIGWHFKKHWYVQGVRVPRDTGAAAELKKLNIEVRDVLEDSNKSPMNESQRVPAYRVEDKATMETCLVYGDENVLLEGMTQAKVLTKCIEIQDFPNNINDYRKGLQLPISVDNNISNAIMESMVFDAEQLKLPKVKLVERPAFTLPRYYGISCDRRIRLLLNKLLFECEKLSGRSVTSRRKLFENARFTVTLPRDTDLVQFSIKTDKLITSSRPIDPIDTSLKQELPNLHPLKCTIGIPKMDILSKNTRFPFKIFENHHPHTIFINFNNEKVRNIHETPITSTQFESRTLLKAFAATASYAKQIYGENFCDQLPKPIMLRSVQTDGRSFHFGVLQLNTLNLDANDELKNYWYHQPPMDLYEDCGVNLGKPYLVGYNKNVLRNIIAFYNS